MQKQVSMGTAHVVPLTSCAVFSECLKDIKSGRGPVWHWESPADTAWRRSVDASHLAIQRRLKMTALPPQPWRNISEEKLPVTQHICNI